MIRFLRAAAAALGLFLLGACGGPAASHDLATISVTTAGGGPALLTALGATLSLQAAPRDAAGNPVSAAIVWNSNAADVANVDSNGLVTAVGNGRATIQASALGLSSALAVTVEQAAGSLAIVPASPQVERGATLALSAAGVDSNGRALAGGAATWAIADPSVATITKDGAVTGLGIGTTSVTVTLGGKSSTANVAVVVPKAATVSLNAATSGALASIGETRQLTASALDARAQPIPEAAFTWKSSDTTVAAVDNTGLVTAAKNGSAVITATSGTASAEQAITVAQVLAQVSVTPATSTLPPDGTVTFAAQGLDARAHPVASTLPAAVWTIDDATVATLDSTGHAHANPDALALKSTHVHASISGVPGAALLTVDPAQAPVASISLSGGGVTLSAIGATVQLSAQALNAHGHPVPGVVNAWSTSNSNFASVDQTGLVTAKGNGIATITVSAGGATNSTNITVVQLISTVAIAPHTPAVLASIGDTSALIASVNDSNGHAVAGAGVAWSSDNTAAATVSITGVVTAVANGTANIKADAGAGHTDSVLVTVHQAITTVTVAPPNSTVAPSSTQDFIATASDARGHPAGGVASWLSDNALVVINSAGHAVIGSTSTVVAVTITATVAGISGISTLTVDPNAAPVDHILITSGGVTLSAVGDFAQLAAQAYDINSVALARTFAWTSNDATGTIATVDSAGKVTAKGNGTASITASAGGKSDSVNITVVQAVDHVTIATHVSGASTSLASINDTLLLDGTAFDHNNNVIPSAAITFASDGAFATFADPTAGTLTAKQNGVVHVTASAAGITSAPLTVTVAQVVASVGVSTHVAGASTTLTSIDDTLPLDAVALDARGTAVAGQAFSWRSDASSAVAIPDATTGTAKAVANGTAHVFAKATANNVESAGLAITVAQAVKSVTVATRTLGASTTLASLGATLSLGATAFDANSHAVPNVVFSWRTDSTNVSVDSSGLVTALANGPANLFAKSGTIESAGFAVSVSQVVASIAVAGTPTTLASINQTVTLTATPLDARGNAVTNQSVTYVWSSNATGVAGVAPSGDTLSATVTAVANGSANISAKSSAGPTGQLTITVAQDVDKVTVTVSAGGPPGTLTFIGQTLQLKATATDALGTVVAAAAFNWSPTTATAATVDQAGLVTARANGTQSITASAGNKSGNLGITVKQVIDTIDVSPATAGTMVGLRIQFTATPKDVGGTPLSSPPVVTWDTDNHAVATIDAGGVATALALGGPINVIATDPKSSTSGKAQLTVGVH